jgi:hypothetical protein
MNCLLAFFFLLFHVAPPFAQEIYGELHPNTPHVLGATVHHQDNDFTRNCLFDCRAIGPPCISFAVYAAYSFHPEAEACYPFDVPVGKVIDTVLDKSHVNMPPFRGDPAWYIHSKASYDWLTVTSTSTVYTPTSTFIKLTPKDPICGAKGNYHPDDPNILGTTDAHSGNHAVLACQFDCKTAMNDRCVSFAAHNTEAWMTCTFFSVDVGKVFFTTINDLVADDPWNPWTFYDDACFAPDQNQPSTTAKSTTKSTARSKSPTSVPTATQTRAPECGAQGHIANYDAKLDGGPWSKWTLTMAVANLDTCLNECHHSRITVEVLSVTDITTHFGY